MAFIALRQKVDEQDLPRENFNINVLQKNEKNFAKSYGEFKKSIGKAEGFQIVEEGEKLIEERKFKYLIETHKNSINKEDMHNYILFTNNNGEILILTMVAPSANFEKFRDLFELIGSSIRY